MKMRYIIVSIILFFAALPAFGQSIVPATLADLQAKGTKGLPVRPIGRVSAKPLPAPMPKGSVGYIHQWPGVYFEAAFKGDSFLLKFNDTLNEYRLFIDGGKPITIAQPGSGIYKVTGLSGKNHKLRLEKVTESIAGTGAFEGFYVGQRGKVQMVSPRKRQIEFVGDSGMTGYGVRSPKRQCTQEEVRLLSDTQIAYPSLTAKHFGADYQVNAYSGRGVIRNYNGAEAGSPLPAHYPFIFYDKSERYDDPSWRPQIILVNLGANDVSTPLNPGEKWKTTEEFALDFVQSYTAFLGQLHGRNPDAALIIVWPNSEEFSDPAIAKYATLGRQMLQAEADRLGFRSVTFLRLDDLAIENKVLKLENTACDYHASISDYQKLTVWLTKYLEGKPELWGDQK
jgi:lysophospholipase L1-like esterase